MAALRRLLPFKRVLSPHLSLSAIAATSINAHMLVSCRLLSTEDRKRADYSDLNNVVQVRTIISMTQSVYLVSPRAKCSLYVKRLC